MPSNFAHSSVNFHWHPSSTALAIRRTTDTTSLIILTRSSDQRPFPIRAFSRPGSQNEFAHQVITMCRNATSVDPDPNPSRNQDALPPSSRTATQRIREHVHRSFNLNINSINQNERTTHARQHMHAHTHARKTHATIICNSWYGRRAPWAIGWLSRKEYRIIFR